MVGAGLAQPTKRPPKKTALTAKDQTIYEADAEMLRDLQTKVRVVESKKDWAKFDRQSPFTNPAKTRSAYIAQFPIEANTENLMDVVVVHDLKRDKFYEIRGFDNFPWRPLSDVKWVSTDVLQFDQWVNPNNGGRYQVNLKTGQIVAAGYVRSQ